MSSVLILAISQAVLSQITSSQVINDEAIDAIDALDALDEVVVYGEPTLRLLRDEVFEAEEQFYELFNALNNGKQFDIRCFYRRPVESLIPQRICEANFVQSPPLGTYEGANGSPRWMFYRHKTRQMHTEMAALVSEHPELHAALLEFANAKQTLDSAFRNRCMSWLSICEK